MGELSLDGSILPIKGALPIAILAKQEGYKGFILPYKSKQGIMYDHRTPNPTTRWSDVIKLNIGKKTNI